MARSFGPVAIAPGSDKMQTGALAFSGADAEEVAEVIEHRPDGEDDGDPDAEAADEVAEDLPIVRGERER